MTNFSIYQINADRDTDRVCFENFESLKEYQNSSEVDSSLYDKVYEREMNIDSLDGIFRKFNLYSPPDYKGRSVSVSDVIEIVDSDVLQKGFYYVDSVGFKKIDFDKSLCQTLEDKDDTEKISVLLVEPGKYPKEIKIEDSLEAMQDLVEGNIEEYMPYDDDVAIICNEEGKMNGLPLNRAIYSNDKEMVDIICGKFFIAYAPLESENFLSMPKDLMEKYKEEFKLPERFSKDHTGNIIAEKYKPKSKDYER